MRIIIESEEKKETLAQRFEEPDIEEGLDGGTPPESLLHLMAAEAPELALEAEPMDVEDVEPSREEGLDGGAPPESLLQLTTAEEVSELVPEAEPMDVEDAGPPTGVEEEGEDSEAGIV
jgi:hypothetical protein